MKLYDFEYILIEYYGEIGTSRRDQFERRVDEAVHAYRIGEAIMQQNLTQEQLGDRVGVTKV